MRYYSTNGAASEVTLKEAIIKGLAPDKGLLYAGIDKDFAGCVF